MTKAILMLGAALVAAGVTISTSAAEARGLRFGLGLGVGLGLGLGAAGAMQQRRYEPRYREPRYTSPQPRYNQPPQQYKQARPNPTPVAPQAAATVRYADNMNRVYDPASGIWHDGQNRCWGGKYQWTFKNGAWFYGSHSWVPSNGTWQTNAPEAPSPIDCRSSPAFASASGGPVAQREGGYADQGEPAPVKAADKVEPSGTKSTSATADGGCKKYFPSIGQMVSVPCTN